jgi:hypothetical protein
MALNRFQGGIDLTYLKHTWQGEWDEGTIYNINDVVKIGGKTFVCINTEMSDCGYYGTEYKPGADSIHWNAFTDGYIYKGQWRVRCRWYKGDVVKYNGDYYVCLEDNLHGHPIFENGNLTTKWKLVFASTGSKCTNHIWGVNMPPMGWTRNYADDNIATFGYGRTGAFSINGDFNFTQIGYVNVSYNYGMGTVATWANDANTASSDTHIHRKIAAVDQWDWHDGLLQTPWANNTIPPKVVQVISNEVFVYLLFDTGEVYAAGVNGQGQLGDGTTTTRPYFIRVGRGTTGRGTGLLRNQKVIKMAVSVMASMSFIGSTASAYYLTDAGEVWSCGYNGHGQIGDGTTTNRTLPYRIPQYYFDGQKVVDVWASGWDYPFVVVQTENDCLYMWGHNVYYAGPGSQNLYTPQKVNYDFTKFGGIKKVYIVGETTVQNIFVLTNDGQMHFSGYQYAGQNVSGGKGMNSAQAFQSTFTTMHQLLNERRNSFGQDSHRQLGPLIDTSKNIDDFWVIGERYPTVIFKEKKTGLMYVMGHRTYSRPFVHARSATMNDYYSDNPSMTSQNLTLPTPINVGNATDIVQMVNTAVPGYAKSLYFLNSDGRAITSNYAARPTQGLGFYAQAFTPGAQTQALPWETAFAHTDPSGPTQFRWKHPISFITQAFVDGNAGAGGVGMVTNNDRYVVSHLGNGPLYYQDHGQQGNSVAIASANHHWPQRVDF